MTAQSLIAEGADLVPFADLYLSLLNPRRLVSEAVFERLLAEVSRDDRDSMLTKTYLTSETGKVYTMLAHASGRFDGA